MRKSIVTAVAAFVLGAISTSVVISWAQPAPPPADGSDVSRGMGPRGPGARGPGMDRGPGQWADRMREHQARRTEMMRAFALIPRPEDRQLTPPDVQKIVEAFLLWNDNHSWKVLNVKAEGDAIGFDLATGGGSVIAHYTMDPKTGRPTRKS